MNCRANGVRTARDLEDRSDNPQANLRRLFTAESNRCREAVPPQLAITQRLLPPFMHTLAGREEALPVIRPGCRNAARRRAPRPATGRRGQPGWCSDGGQPADAIVPLQRALTSIPISIRRVSLAITMRAGRRAEAASTAEDLLRRLPADAPQRSEVELIKATKNAP